MTESCFPGDSTDGSGELITYFACLVCTPIAVTFQLPLMPPVSYLTFTLLILSPSHQCVGVCGAELTAGVSP